MCLVPVAHVACHRGPLSASQAACPSAFPENPTMLPSQVLVSAGVIYLSAPPTKPTLCGSQNTSRDSSVLAGAALWSSPNICLRHIWQLFRLKTLSGDYLQVLLGSLTSGFSVTESTKWVTEGKGERPGVLSLCVWETCAMPSDNSMSQLRALLWSTSVALDICISYFCHRCDQIPEKKQLKEEGFILVMVQET